MSAGQASLLISQQFNKLNTFSSPKKTKLTHYRHLAVPRTERNPLTETAFTLFLANKSYHIPRL
jgi:hypothetical protein